MSTTNRHLHAVPDPLPWTVKIIPIFALLVGAPFSLIHVIAYSAYSWELFIIIGFAVLLLFVSRRELDLQLFEPAYSLIVIGGRMLFLIGLMFMAGGGFMMATDLTTTGSVLVEVATSDGQKSISELRSPMYPLPSIIVVMGILGTILGWRGMIEHGQVMNEE